jgi:hypothetical protein
MDPLTENRVGPSDLTLEEQARLERLVSKEVRPVLLTKGGDILDLPEALNGLLVTVVEP